MIGEFFGGEDMKPRIFKGRESRVWWLWVWLKAHPVPTVKCFQCESQDEALAKLKGMYSKVAR